MDNAPQIPTLGGGKKDNKPALKIKGLAAGMSLIERLKQFKKKDLAFILSGLGVLLMAPLAEHFMLSPDDGSGTLSSGFSSRGGSPFGSGGSPYETGLNGLAPGGVAGGGGDIITPLNVRDPSALVMGPGATQQAPAAAAPAQPSAPPPKEDDSKWKDAIAAGKAGAGEAAKKAGLPVPKVPLSAGGLRGLGAVAGGSGASSSLAPISAANVPNRAAGSNSLTGTSGSGFKGLARGPGTGGNAGAFENLKKNAAAQGSDLNRGGSAASALESAASRDMGAGQAGGGAGQGGSKDDKGPGGNQSKDSKSPGESLEFLRLKQEQEKAIDLKWKLKEKQAMLWPNLREKILESLVMKGVVDPIAKGFGSMLEDWGAPAPAGPFKCKPLNGGPEITIKRIGLCDGKSSDAGRGSYCREPGTGLVTDGTNKYRCVAESENTSTDPSAVSGATQVPGQSGQNAPTGYPTSVPRTQTSSGLSLAETCAQMGRVGTVQTQARQRDGTSVSTVQSDADLAATISNAAKLKAAAGAMAVIKADMLGTTDDARACGTLGQHKGPAAVERLQTSKQRIISLMSDYKHKIIAHQTAEAQKQPTVQDSMAEGAHALDAILNSGNPQEKPGTEFAQAAAALEGKITPKVQPATERHQQFAALAQDPRWQQIETELGAIGTAISKAETDLRPQIGAARAAGSPASLLPHAEQVATAEGGQLETKIAEVRKEHSAQAQAFQDAKTAIILQGETAKIANSHLTAYRALTAAAPAVQGVEPSLVGEGSFITTLKQKTVAPSTMADVSAHWNAGAPKVLQQQQRASQLAIEASAALEGIRVKLGVQDFPPGAAAPPYQGPQ